MPHPPSDTGRLRIELLGSGRVVSEDQSQTLPSGIPLSVLAYLYASAEGRTRDALVEAFWPGKDRGRGLQSLRQTLSRIRRVVGDHRIVAEGRVVGLHREFFDCDLVDFERAVEQGDAETAMELWKGGFLTEARHPECWEVENWLERERSRLQGMLRATLLAAAEAVGPRSEDASAVLPLMDRACQAFPLDERLHRLRFDLTLRAGLLTRAAGLLGEIRAEPDLSLPVGELERALEDARNTEGSLAPRTPDFLPQAPDASDRVPRRKRWAIRLGVLAILMVSVVLLGMPGTRGPRDADLAGHIMLFCSTWGTFRIDDPVIHLFRMDLNGRNKQRISNERGCGFVWLDAQHVMLLATPPENGFAFFRLTPRPNPQAEWESKPLTARFPDGFEPVFPLGFQGGPSHIAGRYGVVVGTNPAGESALFLVDPIGDSIRQITPLGRGVGSPVWDVEREELIWGATFGGESGLWALPALRPNAEIIQLTRSPSKDDRPAISGDQLAFVRGFGTGPTEGDYAIHLLNRTTGAEEVLVSRPWNDFMVRWSPDGRHLCWTSEEFGHFESDIWTMEVESRKMRNLTDRLSGRNYECQWAPDSRTVYFSSTYTGRTQIYRAVRNGRFLENVTRMQAEAEPAWVLPRDIYERFIP
jgi:DNA-binding SARP family transcriptional activator